MTGATASALEVPVLTVGGRLLSDERLAQLVACGSVHAFGLLYERHHRALYRYCRSIVRNEDDAQDALQSAVMRALAALQTSERDVAVRPWLFRIVHNEAVSLLRRRRSGDGPIDGQEIAHVSVEHTVEERERLATLVADIHALGERQRAALLMRELSGLSMAEIAAALSTSPGAAKQALFEARCALHELAEGRAMDCDAVRRTLSERDGRVLRSRKLRAHLRACATCVQFRTAIEARGTDLRVLLPPLPAAPALGLLARAVDLGSGHASETVVISGLTFGAPAGGSLLAKGLAGAAIVTAAAAGTHGVERHRSHPAPSAPQVVVRHALPAAGASAFALKLPPAPGVTGDQRRHHRRSRTDRIRKPTGTAPGAHTSVPAPPPATAPQTVGQPPAPTSPPSTASPGTSGVAHGNGSSIAAPGQSAHATPPGLAKFGGVPPGHEKHDKDKSKDGKGETVTGSVPVAPPQQSPAASAPPATPAPSSGPGRSHEAHGHARADGHPGASAHFGPD